MEKDKLKIIDNKDLVRDTKSKAVLQTNHQKLLEHREKMRMMKNILNYGDDIENLKNDMQEIKSLLLKLTQDK